MRDVRVSMPASSARGTIMAKDPYCEVYKAVFSRAERHGRQILRSRLAGKENGSVAYGTRNSSIESPFQNH